MNRVKSDGMIPDPVPFVPVPLTDEYRTLGNNPVLDSHNQFVGELVKDAVKIGRFVPVVGSVIVIVEGTVAAGKHGVYMFGLVADGDFSGAANAHTAYMLSSAVSIAGNDWLADVSGFDKLLDILDEKGNQNGRLAGAASKELAMLLLPAALARPTNVVRNAPTRQGGNFHQLIVGNPNHANAHGFSIRNINPTGSTTNCAATSVAVDDLLAGLARRPAQNCPLTGMDVFERIYGTQWSHNLNLTQITQELSTAGARGRVIVFGHLGDPAVGHYFNAVNQGGTIRFLCGQGGGAIDATRFVQGEMSIIWTFRP